MVQWLIAGWLGLSLLVALVIGRAARDRRPEAPRPAPRRPEPVPAFSSDLVAVHGVAQTTSMIEGSLGTLRSTWRTMDADAIDRLLAVLHDHAGTAHHVLEGLLADQPLLTARLDALTPDFDISKVDAAGAQHQGAATSTS